MVSLITLGPRLYYITYVWLLHIYRFTKRCAEVNIINKILQSKQDTIKHLNKQLEIKDEELARGIGGLINYRLYYLGSQCYS